MHFPGIILFVEVKLEIERDRESGGEREVCAYSIMKKQMDLNYWFLLKNIKDKNRVNLIKKLTAFHLTERNTMLKVFTY